MQTNDHRSDKRTGPRPPYILLGTDANGGDHLLGTADDTVVVVDRKQRTIGHRERLRGRSVDEWIAYVATARGWADRRYGLSIAEALEGAVA